MCVFGPRCCEGLFRWGAGGGEECYTWARMRICERLAHKQPVFSFEFFPPKTEVSEKVLWRSLEQLVPLRPDFVSVTYGAGGSTQERSLELATSIKRRLGIEAAAHLTCVGATRDEIAAVVDRLGDNGVENILALRGDPPKGQTSFEQVKDGFAYASELIAFIKTRGKFCVGAACYPEKHPEAADLDTDIRWLAHKVEMGADYLVTQMFFDNAHYFNFLDKVREAKIEIPVIPGIMPVTNVGQIRRVAELCGAQLPEVLDDRLRSLDDDPHEVFWAGVSYAAYQCRGLLSPRTREPFENSGAPVPGIHFYTLNRSPATRAIFEMLRLTHAVI